MADFLPVRRDTDKPWILSEFQTSDTIASTLVSGLGTAAAADIGTGSGDVAEGDHTHSYVVPLSADKTIHVAKNGDDTTGNGTLVNPYLTISKALTTMGSPTDAATAAEKWVINVESGYYDEHLTVPAGRNTVIYSNGAVVLGTSDAPGTPRNLTWQIDATKEFGSYRPTLTIVAPSAMESTTSHAARAGAFHITGSFLRTQVDAGGGSSHDTFLYGVKITTAYTSIAGGGNLGQNSLYAYKSFFDGSGTCINQADTNGGAIHLQRFDDCETDGPINVYKTGLARYTEFGGAITVTTAHSTDTPPKGFIGCDFGSFAFTGPSGSFLFDSTCVNLPASFSGGVTAVMMGQGTTATTMAAGDHNHDSDYSAIGHDHDLVYAAIGHDHDLVYQALDSDLTAIAGLTTNGLIERTGDGTAGIVTLTSAGSALLDDNTASDQRDTLGLGDSATLDVGTTTGTVAAGDHTHAAWSFQATASEALAAGDLVQVFTDSGAAKVRKTSASSVYDATGFVDAAVSLGDPADVYCHGMVNSDQTGLTPGARLFLSATAGAVTETAPTTAGYLLQEVGMAVSSSAYVFAPQGRVILG